MHAKLVIYMFVKERWAHRTQVQIIDVKMSESINIFKYRLREYIFDKKQQVDILWLPTGVGRSVICWVMKR